MRPWRDMQHPVLDYLNLSHRGGNPAQFFARRMGGLGIREFEAT